MRRLLTCSGVRFSELRADNTRAVAPAFGEKAISSVVRTGFESVLTNERTSHTATSHDTETTNDSREDVQSWSDDRRNSPKIICRSVVRVGAVLKRMSQSLRREGRKKRFIRDNSARNGVGNIRYERTEWERHTSATRVCLIVAQELLKDERLADHVRRVGRFEKRLTLNPSSRRRLPTLESPVVPTLS